MAGTMGELVELVEGMVVGLKVVVIKVILINNHLNSGANQSSASLTTCATAFVILTLPLYVILWEPLCHRGSVVL